MPRNTQNLDLFVYDIPQDNGLDFSIQESMTDNFVKIDTAYANVRNKIGQPIITLDNSKEDNEIWLEGGEVSKETYSKLYSVYGNRFGVSLDSTKFVLPDFRNRAIWGADSFGYLEAGLPNITGTYGHRSFTDGGNPRVTGAFYGAGRWNQNAQHASNSSSSVIGFDASKANPIYGNSDTVQPPAIKVRVKTRYV